MTSQSQQTFNIPTRKSKHETKKYSIKRSPMVSPKSIKKAQEQYASKYQQTLDDHKIQLKLPLKH